MENSIILRTRSVVPTRRIQQHWLIICIILIIAIAASYTWVRNVYSNRHNKCTRCKIPLCNKDFIWYNHNCYYLSTQDITWHNSVTQCKNINATLLVLQSKHEMAWVSAQKGYYYYHWIGLARMNGKDPLIWIDGTLFSNSTFANVITAHNDTCMVLEPNLIRGAECNQTLFYICKTHANDYVV